MPEAACILRYVVLSGNAVQAWPDKACLTHGESIYSWSCVLYKTRACFNPSKPHMRVRFVKSM